jgi:hypothetical protein
MGKVRWKSGGSPADTIPKFQKINSFSKVHQNSGGSPVEVQQTLHLISKNQFIIQSPPKFQWSPVELHWNSSRSAANRSPTDTF